MKSFKLAGVTILTFLAVLLSIFSVGILIVPFIIEAVKNDYLELQSDENRRRAKQLAQFTEFRLQNGATKENLASEVQSWLRGAEAERGYSCIVDRNDTLFVCHPMQMAVGMSVVGKQAEFSELTNDKVRRPWDRIIADGYFGSGSLHYPDNQSEIVHMEDITGTDWTISTHENTTRIFQKLESLRKRIIWGSALVGLIVAIPAAFSARLVSSRHEDKIEKERQKSDNLLLNILPETIANRLKQNESTIANRHEKVTVLFADLTGFTAIANVSSPENVVAWLNRIFSSFDDICLQNGLEKIKTIGDAYMLCGGLNDPSPENSAKNVVAAGLAMIKSLDEINAEFGQQQCTLRVGVHTGDVVAGVIGKHKFSYDLWGDTVNMAARLESHGEPRYIQISAETHSLIGSPAALPTRTIDLKGIGQVSTWLLSADQSPKI